MIFQFNFRLTLSFNVVFLCLQSIYFIAKASVTKYIDDDNHRDELISDGFGYNPKLGFRVLEASWNNVLKAS